MGFFKKYIADPFMGRAEWNIQKKAEITAFSILIALTTFSITNPDRLYHLFNSPEKYKSNKNNIELKGEAAEHNLQEIGAMFASTMAQPDYVLETTNGNNYMLAENIRDIPLEDFMEVAKRQGYSGIAKLITGKKNLSNNDYEGIVNYLAVLGGKNGIFNENEGLEQEIGFEINGIDDIATLENIKTTYKNLQTILNIQDRKRDRTSDLDNDDDVSYEQDDSNSNSTHKISGDPYLVFNSQDTVRIYLNSSTNAEALQRIENDLGYSMSKTTMYNVVKEYEINNGNKIGAERILKRNKEKVFELMPELLI